MPARINADGLLPFIAQLSEPRDEGVILDFTNLRRVSSAEGLVRLALADNGMGILRSFQVVGEPWSLQASDGTAIGRAMEPYISCKAGEPNEGVGLTLVGELIRLMKGRLLIVSGRGAVQLSGAAAPRVGELPVDGVFRGTLVAMSFRQPAASEYPALLHEAKVRAGLLHAGRVRATFEP